MGKVKIRNKLDHRLLIKGKLLEPNEECEVEFDDHVKYCIEKGLVEEVVSKPPREVQAAEEQPSEEVQTTEEEPPAEEKKEKPKKKGKKNK